MNDFFIIKVSFMNDLRSIKWVKRRRFLKDYFIKVQL